MPVTVAPAPMSVAPTPMATMPAPMAVMMPVMPPPHFLWLEPIDLVAASHGRMGIFIGGKPSARIERLRRKRRGLRACGQGCGARRQPNGESQKLAAFHDLSPSAEAMGRVSLARDECSLNCAFSFRGPAM